MPKPSSPETFDAFRDAHRTGKKPKADILERWQRRIVAHGLDQRGMQGADAYMHDYGKGAGLDKIIALAECAESKGAHAMAIGFWSYAYAKKTGAPCAKKDVLAACLAGSSDPCVIDGATATPVAVGGHWKDLPQDLQPGTCVPWQPVDTVKERADYIADDAFVGQPKRDGEKHILFAVPGASLTQKRSLLTQDTDDRLNAAAITVADARGAFVMEGEMTYISAHGSEHRTREQAITATMAAGEDPRLITKRWCVFSALMTDGKDIRSEPFLRRHQAAGSIIAALRTAISEHTDHPGLDEIEWVPVAVTRAEKKHLADMQRLESREGEIWIRNEAPYGAGKDHLDLVRTKYLTETVVIVTGLTTSTDPDRAFGAIEVATVRDGTMTPVGSVGTGFSRSQAKDIVRRFRASTTEKPLSIRVVHQGLTERGMLHHARFESIA
jgi:hypothetical protein